MCIDISVCDASTSSESGTETHSEAHSQQIPHLELCILTNILSDNLPDSAMTTDPPNPAYTSDFTCLLSGPLEDFRLYSGRHSQWLMDIAHDLCDPSLKRGMLKMWNAAGEMWRNVNPTDPLTASTYLYDTQASVSLSKISERAGKSKSTSTNDGGHAVGPTSTMADRVKKRDDNQCWVTGLSISNLVQNGHLCPKRMGDCLFRVIYSAFVSTPPPTLSIYDEICGITLSVGLDAWFYKYKFGLRLVAPDEYECHVFRLHKCPSCPRGGRCRLTIYGCVGPNVPPELPSLHGHKCVIQKFAHSDYKNLQNIRYYELPLEMDSEYDELTDSEHVWPSAALDRGRAMQMAVEGRAERRRAVTEWVAALQQ